MSIEAMKLALEALEKADKIRGFPNNKKAITALRQAIEKENVVSSDTSQEFVDETAKQRHEQAQKQEPVAYDKTELNRFAQDLYDQKMREGKHGHYESMFSVIHQCIKRVAPPQRQWVGLTADEIWKCNKAQIGSAVEVHICSAYQNVLDFAEAIEAKLRDKNGIAHGIKGEEC